MHMERPSDLAPDVEATATAVVPATFEELFAAHHERLFRALYLIVGNSHEAEELMQDAFLRVLERWDHIANADGLPLPVRDQLDAEALQAAPARGEADPLPRPGPRTRSRRPTSATRSSARSGSSPSASGRRSS